MQLTVYLGPDCLGCDRARELAAEMERAYSALAVDVLDLAQVESLPDEVIAVPAYLLDGRLVSLGNPSLAELQGLIEPRLDPAESSSSC